MEISIYKYKKLIYEFLFCITTFLFVKSLSWKLYNSFSIIVNKGDNCARYLFPFSH